MNDRDFAMYYDDCVLNAYLAKEEAEQQRLDAQVEWLEHQDELRAEERARRAAKDAQDRINNKLNGVLK